jgi:uncharacterized protein (DUF2141 family)
MKKHLFFTIFICAFIIQTSKGQLSLTIEISGLRNSNGQILLELFDEKEISIKDMAKNIVDKKCIIVIHNLKPGKYAFQYFHDENKNEKIDLNWLGIPKEGYGYSNNASGMFGPPAFEKTIFNLNKSMVMKCKPTYIFD